MDALTLAHSSEGSSEAVGAHVRAVPHPRSLRPVPILRGDDAVGNREVNIATTSITGIIAASYGIVSFDIA